MNKIKIGLHGEATLTFIEALPDGVVKQEHTGDLIIAPSETLGHHHRIYCEEKEAVMYEKNGTLYLEVKEPVGVVCADKHDKAVLEPGYYKIGKQFEYDYLTKMTRAVAD